MDKDALQHLGGGRTQVNARQEGGLGNRPAVFNDKFFIGHYEYDPQCFNRPEELALLVWSEGDKKPKTYDIPKSVKNLILHDFEPYWAYMAAKPLRQLQAGSPSFTPTNPASPAVAPPPVFAPATAP